MGTKLGFSTSAGATLLFLLSMLAPTSAVAAQASSGDIEYLAGTQTVVSGGNGLAATQIGSAATSPVRVTLASNVQAGDQLTFEFSLTAPQGTTLSVADQDGSGASTSAMFSNEGNSAAIDDSASSISGRLYTVTFAAPLSAETQVTVGTARVTPDIAGRFTLTVEPRDGSDQAIPSNAKQLVVRSFALISPAAQRLQTATFGTGVDLDADGNVYWSDYSGSAIYKTDSITGVTSKFATHSSIIKVFVDGGQLFMMNGSAQIFSLPLSHSNPNTGGTFFRSHNGNSTYAQAQGFFRIDGKSYISYNINKTGELWEYKDPIPTQATSGSIVDNSVTVSVPEGHGYVVSDTVTVTGDSALNASMASVSAVSATSITYSKTAADRASTSTVAVVTRTTQRQLLADITGTGAAVRGMAPSLDNSSIFLAAGATKKMLKYDFSDGQINTYSDLAFSGFNGPDDISFLKDGSFLTSAFSTGGYMWHIAPNGDPIAKIHVAVSGTTISNGYDLKISPSGDAVYLAAQSHGFLKIPMNPVLAGKNYGVSTPVEPPPGQPLAITSAAADVLSSSLDNVSFSTATLVGEVNANNLTGSASFLYSSDPEFPQGSTVTTSALPVSGASITSVSTDLTGLVPATRYFFKLRVEAGGVTVEGAVRSFQTLTPPTLSAASVQTGPAVGGTAITITGVGLSGATAVKVGGSPATSYTINSGTSISLVTPPQSGTNIQVTTATGIANFTFIYTAPTLSAVSSETVSAGDTLTISGSQLTGTTAVTINGVAASSISVVSDTQVSVTVPSGTGADLDLIITTPSGSSTLANAVSYLAQAAPQTTSSYAGPQFTTAPMRVSVSGGKLTVQGVNLDSISQITVAGSVIPFKVMSPTLMEIRFPALQGGVFDMEVVSSFGRLIVQDGLEVGSGATDLQSTPNYFSKKLPNGQVKLYAKNIVGQGKVQFLMNGREIAWVRAVSVSDRKLRKAGGSYYLVRTIDLVPGKNRVEIKVDGERERFVTYTR